MSRTKPKRDSDPMVISERAAEAVGPYPHARRAGNLLFVSGIGPRRRGSKEIPGVVLDAQGMIVSYDIVEQCRSVFENIRFILEDAGSSWDRIVDVTAFLTDMNDFAAYNKVYAEHFPPENRPSRTTVEVSRLPTPIAVELKVIATID
jgi:2-aminomuconate deaminase